MALSKHEYCRRFSLAEIKSASRNFSDEYKIGGGGFGKVYKCSLMISDRPTLAAVKRLDRGSSQGLPEFQMEIETLGKIQHRNIVSLFGYCKEEGEMLLVYEYIPNHTLHHHLKLSPSSLTCKQRLLILIGAGRGLDHLHNGFPGNSIIHRDVKSPNILLDENFVAKVADFGLAKLLGVDMSHVVASLKFSFGYLDPSFYSSGGILTKESDTFAFGVVILEVLTGKLAFDSSRGDEACLYVWASKRGAQEIVDRDVSENMSDGSLRLCVEVARRCLDKDPKKRLSMTQVVAYLELALKGLEPHPLIQPSLSESTQEDDNNHLQVEFYRLLRSASGHKEAVDLPPLPDIPIHESEDIMNAIMLPEAEAALAIEEEEEDVIENNQSVDVQPIAARAIEEEDVIENNQSVDVQPIAVRVIEEEEDGREKNQSVDRQPIAVPAAIPADRIVDMPQIHIPAFPLAEIKDITDNFSDEYLIAKVSGGGSVFRGVLRRGQVAAIRKFDKEFPVHDFLTQVSKVSRLKHENVVQLIGYCFDDGLQLFIYEFGPWGSLHDILHGRAFSLSQRIKIAVEAGKGLLYLHQKDLIHCNVRSSNVLVFDNDIAKISSLHQRNARCNCRKAYFDGCHPRKLPPCFHSHPPGFLDTGNSKAGDVYHFGILLLELLTGREGSSLEIDVEDFVVTLKLRKRNVKSLSPIMDAGLKGNYPFMAAAKVAEVAIECLQYEAHLRPTMTTVVKDLQFAHQSSQDSLQMRQHNKSNHTSSNSRPTEASTSNSNDRDFQRPNEQDRIFQTVDSVADNYSWQQSPKPVDAKRRGCWGQIWKIPRRWSNSREVKVRDIGSSE